MERGARRRSRGLNLRRRLLRGHHRLIHLAGLPADVGFTSSPYVIDANTFLVGSYQGPGSGVYRSTDAGQTWRLLDPLPGLPSYPFCFNTAGMQTETPIAWGRDSTLYYGLNGWDTQDGGQRANISVLVAKSTDLGDSWTTKIVRNTRGLTGAATENNTPVSSIAVDSSGATDVVYVTWRKALPEQTNPPFQRAPMLAVSTDAGDTWSEPIDLQAKYPKTIKNAQGQDVPYVMSFSAPSLATNDKGALFVIWPLNTFGITPAPPAPIIIGKTTDRGATWEFNDVSPPSPYTEHVNILKWSPAGGPLGSLHVIYEDKPDQTPRGADRDIYYQRSTDDGKTWTQPKLLNDDNPNELAVQITPNIDVTPDGRVDAVWWDFRDDRGAIATDVYYTYSTDNDLGDGCPRSYSRRERNRHPTTARGAGSAAAEGRDSRLKHASPGADRNSDAIPARPWPAAARRGTTAAVSPAHAQWQPAEVPCPHPSPPTTTSPATSTSASPPATCSPTL